MLSAGRLSVRRGSAAGLCASSLRARWGWAVGQAALPGWGPWAGEAAGKVSQRGETSLPAERTVYSCPQGLCGRSGAAYEEPL